MGLVQTIGKVIDGPRRRGCTDGAIFSITKVRAERLRLENRKHKPLEHNNVNCDAFVFCIESAR